MVVRPLGGSEKFAHLEANSQMQTPTRTYRNSGIFFDAILKYAQFLEFLSARGF